MAADNTGVPGGWDWKAGAERREAAQRKIAFFVEQHLPLVKKRIAELVSDEAARPLISAFGTRTNNLVRSVVEAVAVGYSRGVRRELRGLGEGAAKAFAAIVGESGISRQGGAINSLSWLCGPLLVGPSLVDNEIVLDIITPAHNDVRLRGPERVDAALVAVGAEWVEIDGDAWRYFDSKGKLYKEEAHAVGRCPLAIFRCGSPVGFGDWWSSTEHAGLIDASLLLAYKHALGLWCTHNGSSYLTVVNTALANIPAGQSLGHPFLPLVIDTQGGSTSPVQVFDRAVNPGRYLSEMASITNGAVAPYGIPPSEVSFTNDNTNWGVLSLNVRGEKLGLLRDKQVPWLLRGERTLWPMVVDFLRTSTHRMARELPPGDELAEALVVSFPDLASPDDTKKSIEALQAGLGLGISGVTEWIMARRPELTRAEAEAERFANIEDYARGIEMVAARNIPTDDAGRGVESIAQKQGREGGRISGEVRREGAAA